MLEFSSARKRMTVIIKDAQGNIKVMCKGADSVIYKRLNEEKGADVKEFTNLFLEEQAKSGLRTLLIC